MPQHHQSAPSKSSPSAVNGTGEVQVFRAATPRAALAAVKAALGDDAEIVSCAEVPRTLFSAPEIEVIARAPTPVAPPAPVLPPEPKPVEKPAPRLYGYPLRREPLAPVAQAPAPPPPTPSPSLSGARPALYDLLTDRAIDPRLADELALEYRSSRSERGHSPEVESTDVDAALRQLKNRISLSRPPWHPDPTVDRSIVALVGPTGAGKTTTAAKIGARARLEYGLSVAMITVDHHRVGAVAQLGRYGELMGIPVRAARSREAFERAIDELQDKDLVIIDTAGRSPNDHEINAQQASYLRACPGVERHLVLPAATSGAQVRRELRRYVNLRPSRLIISKLDEASAAQALSVAALTALPCSALTDGQRVPEDLHRVNLDRLVERVTFSEECR